MLCFECELYPASFFGQGQAGDTDIQIVGFYDSDRPGRPDLDSVIPVCNTRDIGAGYSYEKDAFLRSKPGWWGDCLPVAQCEDEGDADISGKDAGSNLIDRDRPILNFSIRNGAILDFAI